MSSKPKNSAKKKAPPVAAATACSPRLFEVSVLISRTAVILATSEEEALAHVETWEQAWEENSDYIDVTDKEVTTIRDLKVDLLDWDDEAHDATTSARAMIAERARENDKAHGTAGGGNQPQTH